MPLSTYGVAGETYGQGTYSGGDAPAGGDEVLRSPRYGLTRAVTALLWWLCG